MSGYFDTFSIIFGWWYSSIENTYYNMGNFYIAQKNEGTYYIAKENIEDYFIAQEQNINYHKTLINI